MKSDQKKLIVEHSALPTCIVDGNGRIDVANSHMDEVFVYAGIKDANIYVLTGFKMENIRAAAVNRKDLPLSRNKKIFNVRAEFLNNSTDHGDYDSLILTFIDITEYEALKDRFEKEHPVMAAIHVDNYEELSESMASETSFSMMSQIDKLLRQWAEQLHASLTKYKDDTYFAVIEHQYFEELKENNFAILDKVRNMDSEEDFPVTISIGVGTGGETPEEDDKYAMEALDLALGRGGDQVVIKEHDKTEYYGGQTQTMEKTNKGKSRVIAHALKHLMAQASNVVIMGHANPDMDSFGAALGIHRFAKICDQDPYIVINKYNEALADIFKAAKETDEYTFVSSDRAMKITGPGTLVIVVDTNRKSIVECPELLDMTRRIVVFDHHRRAADYIENPVLAYTESYASSTAELVTEVLQYCGATRAVTIFESEALLAGITVDTNRFAVKTGVRTFEAASWLKRCGADTTRVKRYFQTDMDMFRTRAACISNAVFTEDGTAMSICPGENINAQVVNSQVADEFLTIKGVKVSFVAGRNECGKTVISARSLGEVNVQTIMEKLGGGGHLTTAGAQADMSPEEALDALRKILKDTLKKEQQED